MVILLWQVRPSIMKALTQHNPRVCLTEDDLEGFDPTVGSD